MAISLVEAIREQTYGNFEYAVQKHIQDMDLIDQVKEYLEKLPYSELAQIYKGLAPVEIVVYYMAKEPIFQELLETVENILEKKPISVDEHGLGSSNKPHNKRYYFRRDGLCVRVGQIY